MISSNQQNLLNCVFKRIELKLTTFSKEQMMNNPLKNLIQVAVLCVMIPFAGKSQTIEQAVKDLDAEKFTKANQLFSQIVTANPSAQNLFYQGYAILRSPEGTKAENLKAAKDIFTKGLAVDPKDKYCMIGQAMVKMAEKNMTGATAILDDVKKAAKGKNSDILYRVAEAYTMFPNSNDPGQAIMDIDAALERSKTKDVPEYYFVKSDAFMLKNEGGDAMNALQNAERLNKNLAKTYEKMAKVWLQGRNYREAKDVLEKGIAADPTYAPLYKYQSSYFQSIGKYNESAQAAKKFLENSDGDCKAKLRYAKLAFVAKDIDNVKKTIDEIKSCSTDPYVIRMQGIINFEEKKPEAAIANLRDFISKAPADENVGLDYGYIGRSYLIMPGDGDVKKMNDSLGLLNIEKAVSMKDSSFNYYQDLAATFAKQKNYANAALYAEKNILNKKTPNASDFATVGSYYSAARNWVKSDEYIDKALVEYKEKWADGYALSARIKTYKNTADSAYSANYSAAPLYEKYLSLIGDAGKMEPKNKRNVVDAYRYLAGREYQVNKNIPKATEFLTELLKVDPADEMAKKQMDAVNGVKTVITTPAPPATPNPPGTIQKKIK